MKKTSTFGQKFDASNLFSPAMIIGITVVFTSLVILSVGINPLEAYYHMITGAFGNLSRIIDTLNKMVPIAFAGFAVSMSTRAGVFNMGVEGQLIIGAFGATIAGIYLDFLPAFLHIPVSLLAGMLFGVLYAMLPSLLFVFKQSDMIVILVMMNNIAQLLVTYLVFGPFSAGQSTITATDPVAETAMLPDLITRPNRLSVGVILMLVAAVVLYFFYYRTTKGYELRSLGQNRQAAIVAGIPSKQLFLMALLLSGALGGLAGGVEILGNYHRLYPNFSPGYGFDGIPISALATGNPFGIIIGSFVFGAIRVGSLNMQVKTGIPVELVSVIQGILITLIACQWFFKMFASAKLKKRKKEAAQ